MDVEAEIRRLNARVAVLEGNIAEMRTQILEALAAMEEWRDKVRDALERALGEPL